MTRRQPARAYLPLEDAKWHRALIGGREAADLHVRQARAVAAWMTRRAVEIIVFDATDAGRVTSTHLMHAHVFIQKWSITRFV